MTTLTAFTSGDFDLAGNMSSWSYTTVETGFTIYYGEESSTWDAWTTQVADTTAYDVSDYDTINAAKFSGFMLSMELTTTAQYDGVCLISDEWGTVCLGRNSGNDSMLTYRCSTTDWTSAFDDDKSDTNNIITYLTNSVTDSY